MGRMTGTCGVLPREDRLDRCERTERRLDLVEDGPRVDLPGGEPWNPPVLMDKVCFRLDSMADEGRDGAGAGDVEHSSFKNEYFVDFGFRILSSNVYTRHMPPLRRGTEKD